MSKNQKLTRARKNKNDEFYTRYEDIHKEMIHYKDHLKDKVIYCNCDNPEFSNFYKYFYDNFNEYGIKKLICTYIGSIGNTYRYDYDGKDIIKTPLIWDGSFSSKECLDIMEHEADIIITNPPFSLFRKFIDIVIGYNKKFIVMGNINVIAMFDIFNFIFINKLWLGASIHKGEIQFQVPDSYEFTNEKNKLIIDGKKFINVSGIRWYTNMNYDIELPFIKLTKKYNENEYRKYVNIDAINIDKTSDIPMDYDGIMGVPITFMDKYNPNQFKIIGLGKNGFCDLIGDNQRYVYVAHLPSHTKYIMNDILCLKYDPKFDKNPSYKNPNTGELYVVPYARILIQRK